MGGWTSIISNRLTQWSLISISLVGIGCNHSIPPQEPRIGEEQRYLVHLVRSNHENLGKISRWYTGSEKNTKTLLNLNKSVATDGLQAGEAVWIPFHQLKTVAPLPKETSHRKTDQKKQRAISKSAATSEVPSDSGEGFILDPQAFEVIKLPNPTQNETGALHPEEPDIEPLPTGKDPADESAAILSKAGKSIEQLIQEEKAELERIKSEIHSNLQ